MNDDVRISLRAALLYRVVPGCIIDAIDHIVGICLGREGGKKFGEDFGAVIENGDNSYPSWIDLIRKNQAFFYMSVRCHKESAGLIYDPKLCIYAYHHIRSALISVGLPLLALPEGERGVTEIEGACTVGIMATRRIGIDLRSYEASGIGRYIRSVTPDLIQRLDASEIIAFGHAAVLEREDWACDTRVEIRDYQAKTFGVREQANSLLGFYSGIDLLWAPQYNVPLGFKGKLVVTIHDLCQFAYPETLANDLQRWYARRLLNHVAKKADAIVCVSEFTAGEVKRLLNVEGTKVFTSYPGIDGYWLRAAGDGGENCDPPVPYLLAVGNIKAHKNLASLIRAFALVRESIPHKLVIVGRAHGFRNYDANVGAMLSANDERILFTGEISDEDLRCYYAKADGLIFPSYYEGFGYPLVEAMAQGCAVACSDAASLPEVAAGAALLFNPFDIPDIARAIRSLASDVGLRQELAGHGLRRAKELADRSPGTELARVINGLLYEP